MSGDYVLRSFKIIDLDRNTSEDREDVNAYNVLGYIQSKYLLRGNYILKSADSLDISVRFMIEQYSNSKLVRQWTVYLC